MLDFIHSKERLSNSYHHLSNNTDKIKLYDKKEGGVLIVEGNCTVLVLQRKKDFVLRLLETRI